MTLESTDSPVRVSRQPALRLVELIELIDRPDEPTNIIEFPQTSPNGPEITSRRPLDVAALVAPEHLIAGDGPDRPAALTGRALEQAQSMQDLLRSVIPVLDVEALRQLARLMPVADRNRLIALLRPLITENISDGRPRFDAARQAALTAALNRGEIPAELLAGENQTGLQARDMVVRFLLDGLRAERERGELGPLTRAIHTQTVAWLRRDVPDALRTWVTITTDPPVPGIPLTVPSGTTLDRVLQALRTDNEQSRRLIEELLNGSPFTRAPDWRMGTDDQITGFQSNIDSLAQAINWLNLTRSSIGERFQQGLHADTRINLAWLRRQGLIRPEWAPRVGEDVQEWYSAAGLRAEQARYATTIAQIIVGMRAMPGGENYPPGGHDPFTGPPPFPGTITRGADGRITNVSFNFPRTLEPTAESAAFDRQLAEWISRNEFVIRDFQRMFEQAADQWGILTYANIPMRGRIGENGPEYNLACPRFTTRRINTPDGPRIEVTQTVTYHNSPWWNAHDIVDFEVGREQPRTFTVAPGEMVPVMTSSGIALVRAEDLSGYSSDTFSGAWWTHNGVRAVGIGFDAIMCLTAVFKLASAGVSGTRLLLGRFLSTAAEAQVNAAARRMFMRSIGGFVYSGLLGGTTFLTSSEFQNRRDWLGYLPNIRHAAFILDAARQLPGALRCIGARMPGINRLAWIRGAAQETDAATTIIRAGLPHSRWLRIGHGLDRVTEGGTRVVATGLEVALVSQILYGFFQGGPGFQARDVEAFRQGRNMDRANMDFLSRFVTNLTNGERVAGLDAIVEATRTHRLDMPAGDRTALINRLTGIVDNTGAPQRERTTAAIALALILNREQREGLNPGQAPRALSAQDQQRLDRALLLLERQSTDNTLSHQERLAAGQGLLALGRLSPHAYCNMLQTVIDDRNAPEALRRQCVLGMGTCLMLIREMEDRINDPGTRSAYLARAYRCTAQEVEERLRAIAGGANGATDDMRAAAIASLHALNRDNRGQAEQILQQLGSWHQNSPTARPGDFARWYVGEMTRQMNLPVPQGTEEVQRVYWENRLAAALALRALAGDNALMTRLGSTVTPQSIRDNLVDCARHSYIFHPQVGVQAILALDNLDGLSPEQLGHVGTAYETLLRMRPIRNTPDELAANIIMQEALLRNAHLIMPRLTPDQRARLIETIAGLIDPSRTGQNGGDPLFAAESADVREGAIRALLRIHAQHPLPNQVIRLIAARAQLVSAGPGQPHVPNEPNAAVRLVAFEALRRMGYVTRLDAGIDMRAIAQSWLNHEPDFSLRMTAQNMLLILNQQAMPERQAILDAGNNPRLEVPAVAEPMPIDGDAVQRWINARYPGLLEPPRLPDGTPLGPNLESSILASINTRYGGFLGRLQFVADLVISPIDYRHVRDGRDYVRAHVDILRTRAINAYIEQFNRLMVEAQGTTGEADQARRAIFWIARGGWRQFPQPFQEAAAIMSVRALTTLTEGYHSAMACRMMESLIESNDTHPVARLILLNGLREHRDNSPNNSYHGRYAQILERVFSQLISQRPNINDTNPEARRRAEWHYALLGEIIGDLSYVSNLRSPYFLSRLEAMARDNTVPANFRLHVMRCLGRVYGWTSATYDAWRRDERPNPAGNTPAERARHLEAALRNPGEMPHALPLVEAIFNSVRGQPFVNDDPRLPLLLGIIWTGSETSVRAQIAACRAAFLVDVPQGAGNERARQQVAELRAVALLRLSLIAQYGPGSHSGTIEWTVQEEARSALQELLLGARDDAQRAQMQQLIDQSALRARRFREGVAGVLIEVGTLLSGPLGASLLGDGGQREYEARLGNLRQIAENAGRLQHIDLVTLLVQSLTDVREGRAVPWRPALRGIDGRPQVGADGQPVLNNAILDQIEGYLSTIMNNGEGDPRLRLTAAIHILINPPLFSNQARRAALDVLVRISNMTPAGNPMWLQEARGMVNQIMSRAEDDSDRRHITAPGRPVEMRPIAR